MLFKGTGDAHGRGHRPGDRLDRRPARRVHGQGIRQLLHQGAGRAPAARVRHPLRHRAATRRFDADDIEKREEGHPRRDQDGRGHAGRSRPRAVHAALLGRASARPADPRDPETVGVLHRRDRCATTSATPTSRRNLIVVGGGQHRARAGSRPDRARVRQAAVDAARRSRRAARGRAAGASCATRSSSRATSASAPAAIRRTTTDRYVELHAEHRARRVDELAAVPERAREARPGLRRVQRPERVSRRRATSPSTPAAPTKRSARSSTSCVEELRGMKARRCPTPSCGGRRIISRAA